MANSKFVWLVGEGATGVNGEVRTPLMVRDPVPEYMTDVRSRIARNDPTVLRVPRALAESPGANAIQTRTRKHVKK